MYVRQNFYSIIYLISSTAPGNKFRKFHKTFNYQLKIDKKKIVFFKSAFVSTGYRKF